MTPSKTIVGTAILAMSWMSGTVSSGQETIGSTLPNSAGQAQILNLPLADDSLCFAARQLAAWVCGDLLNAGITQLTDGFVGQVDLTTWASLEPIITNAMDDIDVILDPNQNPSLNPVNAGSGAAPINSSSMSTEEMGDDLCARARAAADEICNSSDPDHEYAGTQFRQMRWLLDDLYDQAQP